MDKDYIDFIENPANWKNCKDCPENKGFDGSTPCNYFTCMVMPPPEHVKYSVTTVYGDNGFQWMLFDTFEEANAEAQKRVQDERPLLRRKDKKIPFHVDISKEYIEDFDDEENNEFLEVVESYDIYDPFKVYDVDGNYCLDEFDTLKEALEAIQVYEAEDRENEDFKTGKYEIRNKEGEKIKEA